MIKIEYQVYRREGRLPFGAMADLVDALDCEVVDEMFPKKDFKTWRYCVPQEVDYHEKREIFREFGLVKV